MTTPTHLRKTFVTFALLFPLRAIHGIDGRYECLHPFQKNQTPIDFSSWDGSERVYVSVVVVSELLMGVHRADTEERRQRRSAFVEAVISGAGVLDITIAVARDHTKLCADLT